MSMLLRSSKKLTMYRKRMGSTSIIEITFVTLIAGILAVSTLHIKDVVYVSRAKSMIDYIEKQDSMWRQIKDMGYGPKTGALNVANLRYNRYCQEVDHDDPTAVVMFDTYDNNNKWLGHIREVHPINCLYVVLGILPREVGIKIEKSLLTRTRDEVSNSWNAKNSFRKKGIWIGKSEFSPNGINGFETYAPILKSNMLSGSNADDVLDAYFFDVRQNYDRQDMKMISGLAVDDSIDGMSPWTCKARVDISGKLIHFIEIKGKDSIVSRRYAQCSFNKRGCSLPKSVFTGLSHSTGIGPIENMTGSSCSNRKSTKNECILVTRRMQEFAPWEDWYTINRHGQ